MDRGNDPPYFARANQNIVAAIMLLRGLSEPNDPHEQAIHRNLQALVETAAIQQAECSVSQRRLVASPPIRGTGTQQMGCSTQSPLQSSSAVQEAASAPRLDLTIAPHRPPMYARLEPEPRHTQQRPKS
jgi:hypothetical protein